MNKVSDRTWTATYAKVVQDFSPDVDVHTHVGKVRATVHLTVDLSDVGPVDGMPRPVHLLISVKPPVNRKEHS